MKKTISKYRLEAYNLIEKTLEGKELFFFPPLGSRSDPLKASEIFSGKDPRNFTIEWIRFREDIIFFLPDQALCIFLPAFSFSIISDIEENGSITNTDDLARATVGLDYTSRPTSRGLITENRDLFLFLISRIEKAGIISKETYEEKIKELRI